MTKKSRNTPPTRTRSTRTRTGSKLRAATARRKAAAKRKRATAANPLPLNTWVRGMVRIVKKGRKKVVQFAK